MAKLPIEESEIVWTLKRQLLEIINTATAAEETLFSNHGETELTVAVLDELKRVSDTAAEETLFSNHGETELTVAVLDELKRVSERATPWFSRLSNLQVRIAESQPDIAFDMLDLLNRSIIQIQIEVPALERSIQEVKQDWNLS
jgi:hypothetical protein